jgi:hypothetical protein
MIRVLLFLSGVTLLLLPVPSIKLRQFTFAVQQQTDSPTLTEQQRAIKVEIMTGGGPYGPATSQFHVGERVPVSIRMTNTGNQPVKVCVSSSEYQNMPKLSNAGQVVAIRNEQLAVLKSIAGGKTCESLDLPDVRTLTPSEPAVVDWFVLAKGKLFLEDDAWYDQLPVGTYELTLQRRFGCCIGPMVESNKISFEVIP